MIKSLLQTSALTFVAGMMFSCTEDLEGKSSEFTTDRIVINLTESADDGMIVANTRSVPDTEKSGDQILTSKSGKKMYLSCTEAPWPSVKTATTRGAKVTTAGISNIGVSVSVYSSSSSYTSAGCGSYFYKESVSSGTPTRFFWPTSDYKISFFGYYPYNNAAFTVQSVASATGAPTYAYTVPSTITDQQDIMTGQVVDQLGGNSSAVNMTLSHRCSAIHFSITNDRSSAITVNSISIEGVKYSGTLNENTWTLGGSVNSSSTNPFTLTYGSSVAAGATVDITGTSNIFMMLPQTLPSGAKLKVVVDDEEFEAELTGTWIAGKEYVYGITINETVTTIDLSMVDNAGTARASMTTANCYLVHAAGDYKLPLVYGNAIKDGAPNTVAFYPNTSGQLTRFLNHDGIGITGPWITKSGSGVNAGMGLSATSAELLWQDRSGLITSVSINGDYLEFTVGSFGGGNALIAVKNGSTILWSWHIWATTETLTNLTSINTGSHTNLSGASAPYRVAPVNLGWVPTGGSGKQGYCTYYQWGRKDPFIPASSYNSTTNHTVYNISGSTITGLTYQASTTATIADNIKNPTYHYFNSSTYGSATTTYYNMWDAQVSTTENVTSATKKTIYDPCPPGFCVPTGNLFYYMSNGSSRSMTTWDSTNKGATWNIGITGDTLWFPATGERWCMDGLLYSVGNSSRLWSASQKTSTIGRMLGCYSDRWFWDDNYKSYGCVIRPVAEE